MSNYLKLSEEPVSRRLKTREGGGDGDAEGSVEAAPGSGKLVF